MQNVNSQNQLSNIIKSLPGEKSNRAFLETFTKDFKSQLNSLMLNLLNTDEDLVVNGITIPAAQKNGAAATFLLNDWMSTQDFISSQLLDNYKFGQKMDSKADTLIGG